MKTCAIFDNSFFMSKPKWMPKKLHRGIRNRANPRSQIYMTDLLHEKFPTAKLIDKYNVPTETEQIILLYPDAIGLGWSHLENSYLKSNLIEICEALLALDETNPTEIFGTPDNLKLKSSMTLFSIVDGGENNIFDQVLNKFYQGEQDESTVRIWSELTY